MELRKKTLKPTKTKYRKNRKICSIPTNFSKTYFTIQTNRTPTTYNPSSTSRKSKLYPALNPRLNPPLNPSKNPKENKTHPPKRESVKEGVER